jgi:alkanesulfonate monooxygenase SsuD/methylene tetrahydromethanopterin reductase-like flavin-dependent oxidoreductase (luciferase family)
MRSPASLVAVRVSTSRIDAHAVRWPVFETSLSAGILDEYLGRLPEDVVAEARQRAIAIARRYPDVHQSLHLLAEFSPDIAADLDLKGDFFQMEDCRCVPLPAANIPIICAAPSDVGTRFAAQYAD